MFLLSGSIFEEEVCPLIYNLSLVLSPLFLDAKMCCVGFGLRCISILLL